MASKVISVRLDAQNNADEARALSILERLLAEGCTTRQFFVDALLAADGDGGTLALRADTPAPIPPAGSLDEWEARMERAVERGVSAALRKAQYIAPGNSNGALNQGNGNHAHAEVLSVPQVVDTDGELDERLMILKKSYKGGLQRT